MTIREEKYGLYISIGDVPNFDAIREAIKACPAGRRYIPEKREWEVPICVENLQSLLRGLERLDFQAYSRILEIANRLIPQQLPGSGTDLQFNSITTPMPHQQELVSFLLQYPGRGYLICGAIGIGKTAIMAYLIANRFQDRRILIVAPNKVKPVWPRELYKHAGVNGFHIIEGKQTKKKREQTIAMASRIIVNYESLHCLQAALIKFMPHIVIADESHRIKNPKSQCTKAFHAILDAVNPDHVYCMTGTPRANSDIDMYSQVTAVNPWAFGTNYYGFLARWFAKRGGFDMYVTGKNGHRRKINTGQWTLKESRKEEFQNILRFVSVYYPNTVIKLPPITYEVRYAYMSDDAAEKYREVRLALRQQVENGETTLYNALCRDSKLMQVASGFLYSGEGSDRQVAFRDTFKTDLLLDILENEIESDAAVIIWFNYLESLHMAERALTAAGISFLSVHGDTKDVSDIVDRFEAGEGMCLLATNVIAEGQTILRPMITVKADHNFQWLPDFQRTGRNYRNGQDKPVVVFDLVTYGTIEERAYAALQEKEERCKEILESIRVEDI